MPRGRPRANPEELRINDPITPESEVFDMPEEQESVTEIGRQFPGVNVYASLGTKINTGNYENIDVSFGISGIPIDASDEYIVAASQKAIGRIESLLEPMFDELATRIEGVKRGYGLA